MDFHLKQGKRKKVKSRVQEFLRPAAAILCTSFIKTSGVPRMIGPPNQLLPSGGEKKAERRGGGAEKEKKQRKKARPQYSR